MSVSILLLRLMSMASLKLFTVFQRVRGYTDVYECDVACNGSIHASTTQNLNYLLLHFVFRSSLVESYKKKTKVELQRSIKSLKDDNAMFTKLNQDLRRILTGVSSVHAK